MLVDVLDGMLDDVAMVDVVAAELVGPGDDLAVVLPAHRGDQLAVGRAPHAVDALRVVRGVDDVLDDGTSCDGRDVLVEDRLRAGARGDDGDVGHGWYSAQARPTAASIFRPMRSPVRIT